MCYVVSRGIIIECYGRSLHRITGGVHYPDTKLGWYLRGDSDIGHKGVADRNHILPGQNLVIAESHDQAIVIGFCKSG